MYKKPRYYRSSIKSVPTYEAEPLETKVERILTQNEPITDGAPIIYTDKKDGVAPQHNVRTDRFEIAAETMDVVHRNKAAKVEKKAEAPKPPKEDNKGAQADE